MKSLIKQIFSKANDWRDGIPTSEHSACFDLWLDALKVGSLEFASGLWKFSYSEEFKGQTKIRPLIGFPDIHHKYESSELWPFFVLRVPSLSQPAVQAYMRHTKSTKPDEVTLLREFGRRSIANPYELVTCT